MLLPDGRAFYSGLSPIKRPENCVGGGIELIVTRVLAELVKLLESERLTSIKPVVSSVSSGPYAS